MGNFGAGDRSSDSYWNISDTAVHPADPQNERLRLGKIVRGAKHYVALKKARQPGTSLPRKEVAGSPQSGAGEGRELDFREPPIPAQCNLEISSSVLDKDRPALSSLRTEGALTSHNTQHSRWLVLEWKAEASLWARLPPVGHPGLSSGARERPEGHGCCLCWELLAPPAACHFTDLQLLLHSRPPSAVGNFRPACKPQPPFQAPVPGVAAWLAHDRLCGYVLLINETRWLSRAQSSGCLWRVAGSITARPVPSTPGREQTAEI